MSKQHTAEDKLFPHKDFGARVRAWREAIKPTVTERDLATTVGVSASFINHIETGRSLPSRDVTKALAAALGVPQADMLRAAGFLTDESDPLDSALPPVPELRLFFTQDWPLLTDDDHELLVDFIRMLKSRLKRRLPPTSTP